MCRRRLPLRTERHQTLRNLRTAWQEALDAAWSGWIRTAEAELCDLHDLCHDDGRPMEAYCGRHKGARFKWRKAFPPMAGVFGAASPEMVALHKAEEAARMQAP